MIKINYIEETELKPLPTNPSIYKFMYEDKIAYGSLYGEEHNLFEPERIINNIASKIDISDLNIDVVVIPMKLHLYDTPYLLGKLYYGEAFYPDNLIFSGAVSKEEDVHICIDTLVHEIGHFVTTRDIIAYPDKYNEFKAITGRSKDEDVPWDYRPKEYLAEYFTKIIMPNYNVKVDMVDEAFDWLKENLNLKEVVEVSEPKQIRDLNELEPSTRYLADKFKKECKASGIDITIYETYRTQERQNWLYKQGRENPYLGKQKVTWTTNSKHTSRKAFDFCPIDSKGNCSWSDTKAFHKCGAIGEVMGLTWGGYWNQQDMPHMQFDGSPIEQEKPEQEVSEWAREPQKWVRQEEISDGTRPKDLITREEAWTMLYRYDTYIDTQLDRKIDK